jgi:hypothetical protein
MGIFAEFLVFPLVRWRRDGPEYRCPPRNLAVRHQHRRQRDPKMVRLNTPLYLLEPLVRLAESSCWVDVNEGRKLVSGQGGLNDGVRVRNRAEPGAAYLRKH